MLDLTTRPLHRAAAGVLAGTLALSGAAVAAVTSPAAAAPSFQLERIAGPDRYATSAKIADEFGASTGAILASGESGRFADALSANFLAGVRGVPVLLTQRDAVPPVVLAALQRAGVRDITLVGGTEVISAEQEKALRSEGFTVTRLGGTDRFATSQQVIVAGQAGAAPIGIVATGLDFADALGAGPLSYRGRHPMFLVRRDSVPAETLAAMRAAGTTSVIVVGGEAVVGQGVVDALRTAGITVATRIAGADRSATSVALADHLMASGYEKAAFNLASGQNGGVDALGGAALSGKQGRALLITNTATNAGHVTGFVRARRASLTGTGYVFGGPAAVSDAVLAALEAEAVTGATDQSFVVTVGGANGVVPVGGTREYAVQVGSATTVDIQLFSCSDVTTGADGVVTFRGTDPGGSGNAAALQDVRSTVTTVNGVAGASPDEVVPRGGVVTFTVTAHADDTCVVPVVFADEGDRDRLMLDPAGRPSSPFGVGGQLAIRAADAPASTLTSAVVTRVDTANDLFETGSGTSARALVYVPGRDVFRLAGPGGTSTVLTAAQFEARLSVGDSVSGVYDPTQGSTFTLTDLAPSAPTGVATRSPQGTNAGKAGLDVVFDDSTTASVASYAVLRAAARTSTVIGEPATCPDPSTSAGEYAPVGTVADAQGQASYVLFDGSAVPPASGQSAPQYCYVVRAVDQSGDSSDVSAVAGPATAAPATTTPVPAMSFVADGTVATGVRTIRVRYSSPVNAATVTGSGSDVAVTSTSGGVVTALQVASAAVGGTNTDVVVTLAQDVPATGDLRVAAQTGTDGNTVCADAGTTNCQQVGQTVLVPVDRTAPVLATAEAALNGADNDTVVLNYSEAVGFFGAGSPSLQFRYEPDCDGGLNKALGGITQLSTNSLMLTLADGTLPATLDENDCVRYVDADPAVEPGDVVDASGNAQATGEQVSVPVPTA